MDALHVDEEWFCRAAWREISSRSQAPDIVHAHALYQAARLRRGPAAVVLNFPGEPNPRYAADIRQADALVADGWAARHLPGTLGRPVHAVPKGVDTELFRPSGANLRDSLGLGGKRTLLCVARFVPIKNVALLIDAMARVAAADPLAHLILVGEGPDERNLKTQAARLALNHRITFAGHARHHELAPFYRSADLFVLPSDFDNSPNVVLEAMSCGLAVVATDVGGVPEYVAHGKGGALTPARDADALGRTIVEWLDAAARRREAGAFNRQRAVQQFSWRASAKRLLGVYETVLAGRQAQVPA
jgi:glycosyltransferase involved in cell wall biosynthesis